MTFQSMKKKKRGRKTVKGREMSQADCGTQMLDGGQVTGRYRLWMDKQSLKEEVAAVS